MPLTVFCVWTGDKFGPEYPDRLIRGVDRNLSRMARYVCITDRKTVRDWEVEPAEKLNHPEEGCWHKLQLFRRRQGTCLYLDLDVVVTGEVDSLLIPPDDVRLHGMKELGQNTKLNSSALSWNGETETLHHIWHARLAHKGKFGKQGGPWRGDQNFIDGMLTEDDVSYMDGADSFKYTGWRPSTRVLVFHGQPKPHTLPHDHPASQLWRR